MKQTNKHSTLFLVRSQSEDKSIRTSLDLLHINWNFQRKKRPSSSSPSSSSVRGGVSRMHNLRLGSQRGVVQPYLLTLLSMHGANVDNIMVWSLVCCSARTQGYVRNDQHLNSSSPSTAFITLPWKPNSVQLSHTQTESCTSNWNASLYGWTRIS